MSAVAPTRVSAGDRLSLTLFVSIAVHALVILGVGFTWQFRDAARTPPMIEVVLADNPTDEAPEEYDFLAQANQAGGGEAEEAKVPEKPRRALTPGVPEGRQAVDTAPAPSAAASPDRRETVAGAARPEQTRDDPAPKPLPNPSLAELLSSSHQVATSSDFSEITASIDARYPSKRRIDARTRAHAAAAYMRQWVEKVERVGNLNYPSEARSRGLNGRLILEVTLRPNGSVQSMEVLRTSSHAALDQAARRIVDLAAPFARVPTDVLQGNDLLVITRTWEFEAGQRFSSGGG